MIQQPTIFKPPNSMCRRWGLVSTWKSSNTIGVYNFKASNETYVHNIRPHIILFDPILRKLINESVGTFLRVQHMTDPHVKAGNKISWLNISLQYRSVIRACIENLEEEADNQKNEELKKQYSSYLTIFYSIECIWHLLEIFYVSHIPGEVVLNSILEWVRFRFPEHENNALKLLNGSLKCGAEVHPKYWDTVMGVFMQGRIELVRNLLRLHTASDSEPFEIADSTLKIMPIYNVFSGISIHDFQFRWKHWQLDTQTKIDSKTFAIEKNLELMMKLAVGDPEIWESEGIRRCSTWYEYMASQLFYSEPFIKRVDMAPVSRKYYKFWPETKSQLDKIILIVMEQDIHQIIHEVQQMAENGWFATHMIDLLYNCDALKVLNTEDKFASSALRNALINDYGILLMSHHSLWQVGAEYLSYSDRQGIRCLELAVERIPLGSEARSLKIMQIAHKHKFYNIVNSICKQRARLALQRQRLGHALGWALKSRDPILCSQLADTLLKLYCEQGVLKSTDLLDSLGSSMLLSNSERLIFLGKYCEFHKFYQSKEFKQAASLLIALLGSKLTPKYFWSVLLTNALSLLEYDDIVFTASDTYELLQYIEQYSDDENLVNKIELLRLAAARNLSRALINEIQQTAVTS